MEKWVGDFRGRSGGSWLLGFVGFMNFCLWLNGKEGWSGWKTVMAAKKRAP